VRGVLVRAEGVSFSAGLDRRMLSPEGIPGEATFRDLAALPPAELDGVIAAYQEAFTWLRRPDLVTVAAVQGHAVGAGFQLALACDLRILAADAQLCMREPTLGLVPDLTGTGPLVDAVGYSRALEICLSGRWVEAEEALAIGLACEVTSVEALASRSRTLLDSLVQGPRPAASETKALLQAASAGDRQSQYAAERAAQGRLLRGLLG
jgi:enoyl-CoA hydratase/carnithine racemase